MGKVEIRCSPELMEKFEKDVLKIIPKETFIKLHKLFFENR